MSSDEEESLAKGREKRCNAGARMSKLIDAEEEDDFYKTTYGGFADEAGDNDYDSEASVSDRVDSDFDIDENDEVKSDDDDDQPKRKRKGVDTKAYKEPHKPKSTPDQSKESKPKPSKPKVKHTERSSVQIYHSPAPKKLRHTTSQKSAQAMAKQQERDVKTKMLKDMAAKKNVSEVRRLTQGELLAEARITEQININSLETYRLMELEKKRARGQKHVYRGPIIRIQSTTMPLIEDMTGAVAMGAGAGGGDTEINVEEEGSDNGNGDTQREAVKKKPSDLKPSEKCSRTFVTFTDEKSFREYFPHRRRRAPVKQYCPVTRLPAKYLDPITQVPYANAQAFRIIREAYAQQMETAPERRRGSKTPTVAQTV